MFVVSAADGISKTGAVDHVDLLLKAGCLLGVGAILTVLTRRSGKAGNQGG
jgi:hypothetical protein